MKLQSSLLAAGSVLLCCLSASLAHGATGPSHPYASLRARGLHAGLERRQTGLAYSELHSPEKIRELEAKRKQLGARTRKLEQELQEKSRAAEAHHAEHVAPLEVNLKRLQAQVHEAKRQHHLGHASEVGSKKTKVESSREEEESHRRYSEAKDPKMYVNAHLALYSALRRCSELIAIWG